VVKVKVLPYKLGSQSAKAIARLLGVKRIIPEGGYVPTTNTLVINWGNSQPHFRHARMLNKPEAVRRASDKLAALAAMKSHGVPVPDFTVDPSVARTWMDDGYRVVVRHKLSAHSGQGIQIIRPGETLPMAPLYTRYTKKDREFRVHVFAGQVIDASEKRRRHGEEVVNSLIRNHANGWVFCREGLELPMNVRSAAIQAVQSLGLDFGGVDVIFREGRCWVLEVNTAPGVEGTTLDKYTQAIRNYIYRF
jgi:glutathione synthase/RimK-type ligase-like ATP-grasp enzyme